MEEQGGATQEGNGERIVGIIPAVRRKTGLFSSKVYNLVVTDRRIVFAEATKELLNQAAADAARETKEQGKGFLARTFATATSSTRVYEKYRQMTPRAILTETGGNYAVALEDVKSVRFNIWTMHMRQEQQQMGRTGKDEMVIKTTGEKIKLIFEYWLGPQPQNAEQARGLLRQVLGKKVG